MKGQRRLRGGMKGTHCSAEGREEARESRGQAKQGEVHPSRGERHRHRVEEPTRFGIRGRISGFWG